MTCTPVSYPNSSSHSKKLGVLPEKGHRGRDFKHLLGTTPPEKILSTLCKEKSSSKFQLQELVVVKVINSQGEMRTVFGRIGQIVKKTYIVETAVTGEMHLGDDGYRHALKANKIAKIPNQFTEECFSLDKQIASAG